MRRHARAGVAPDVGGGRLERRRGPLPRMIEVFGRRFGLAVCGRTPPLGRVARSRARARQRARRWALKAADAGYPERSLRLELSGTRSEIESSLSDPQKKIVYFELDDE